MAHYSSDSELYGDLGECLREVLCDPANSGAVQGVGTVIRLETVRPKARITLDFSPETEPQVVFGDDGPRPAAVVTMEADAARDFFLGELSFIGALSGNRAVAEGPVAPILRVVPLANLVAPAFRERGGGPPSGDVSHQDEPPGAQEADGAEVPGEEKTPAESPEGEQPPDGEEPATGEQTEAEEPPAGEAEAGETDAGGPAAGDQS